MLVASASSAGCPKHIVPGMALQVLNFGPIKYMKQPWNVLDLSSIGLVLACIITHTTCIGGATPTRLRAIAGVEVRVYSLPFPWTGLSWTHSCSACFYQQVTSTISLS